ncbi:hypothetical protein NFI96_012090 [Prochilodus magdalenae]|nr:hypothetical protein NFI96_012090 [Prochilodus magdalenae]
MRSLESGIADCLSMAGHGLQKGGSAHSCPPLSPVVANSGCPASMGVVQAVGDSYYLSVDVSQFEPHDVVVMAYNHNVVIHAEKVGDDESVKNKFTHKSLLPEDMDPLSVSGTLTPEGTLMISVRRKPKPPASVTPTCQLSSDL